MLINNVELEDIDIYDLETSEKYEVAIADFQKVVGELKSTTNEDKKVLSSVIRRQCNAVFDCFNAIFGTGTDKKIFGNKTNLMVCLKAFEELAIFVNKQKDEMEKMANKYSPNRAQKRAK
ncbi:DUF6673 family protein [Clostridium lacusfryxellense]|uniref:DUF6673 family protein n=1 Tax=Clostridium lacusfryxellense TaxID=205328 RepID=UPI001C0B385C|nr:DUF6673 family protein [Clostridium lacusfryxellense]MBU3112004.1 AP endonuclease [Clostridium lacusfryxellense]